MAAPPPAPDVAASATTAPPPPPGRFDALDLPHLRRALALARHAIGLSEPNPRVGCVLTDAGRRQVLAEGHTRHAGGPHAEADALARARESGTSVAGGCVYVTLEPCAHHGRTPPCADALVAGGVARVVVAGIDPFPQVAGRGLARLREAGIEVVDLSAPPPDTPADLAADARALAAEAVALNVGFFHRVATGRPWVRMKIAASMDGRTALPDGTSQWITGEAARADGHAWRARAGAVLTGAGTVLQDDPRLDVRHVAVARQPLRVVVDARLQTAPSAHIYAPPGAVRVYAAQDTGAAADALRAAGATLVARPDPRGKVDLAAMLDDLGAQGVNELHVEAGAALNASLLSAGLVDELLLYVAPRLLGEGAGLARLGPYTALDQGPAFDWVEAQPVGTDLRLRARARR